MTTQSEVPPATAHGRIGSVSLLTGIGRAGLTGPVVAVLLLGAVSMASAAPKPPAVPERHASPRLGAPELLVDLKLDPLGADSFARPLAELDGKLILRADDPLHGREPWILDEPGAEPRLIRTRLARLVADINPIPLGGDFFVCPLVSLGQELFLVGDDGLHGAELWSFETSTRRLRMVRDIAPGSGSSDIICDDAVELDGIVYFAADDGSRGRELWRTDGTEDGTYLVKDINPTPGTPSLSTPDFTVSGGRVFFQADDGVVGRELWVSDGTENGTRLVLDVTNQVIGGSAPEDLTDVNGILYFEPILPKGLWRSDGTEEGTWRITPFASADDLYGFVEFENSLYFHSRLQGFWVSDGTAASTSIVTTAGRGLRDSATLVAGGLMYFIARDSRGYEVWVSDGSEAGTRLLADIAPGTASSQDSFTFPFGGLRLAELGELAVFMADDGVHGKEIWASDGTEAGTRLLRDIRPGPDGSGPIGLASIDGVVLFYADDGVNGWELWRTDGTPEGTTLVRDVNPFASSIPISHLPRLDQIYAPAVNDGLAYFGADDGLRGLELWETDGREAGTVLVADAQPGDSALPGPFVTYGEKVFFSANDGVHGRELWISDGTRRGTHIVADINPEGDSIRPEDMGVSKAAVLGDALMFPADDGVHGRELWRSDGTPEGTRLVRDIYEGPRGSWGSQDVIVFDGALYFRGFYEDSTGFVSTLFKSDGTREGTGQVGETLVAPSEFEIFGDLLFFRGNTRSFYSDLWRTDGTSPGTQRVRPAFLGGVNPTDLTVAGDRLFYSGTTSHTFPRRSDERELWVSDGTSSGTRRVKDIFEGVGGSDPGGITAIGSEVLFFANDGVNDRQLWRSDGTDVGTFPITDLQGGFGTEVEDPTVVGDRVFFSATTAPYGRELWVTDGTAAGTRMVVDLVPGPEGSAPAHLANVGGLLVFAAADGVHGAELWVSDGTVEGTLLLQDIAPGPVSSTPRYFTVAGERVYFAAGTEDERVELWSIGKR